MSGPSYYRLSFADSLAHMPQHPERTAVRPSGIGDVTYAVYLTADAMDNAIHAQHRRRGSLSGDLVPWATTRTGRRITAGTSSGLSAR